MDGFNMILYFICLLFSLWGGDNMDFHYVPIHSSLKGKDRQEKLTGLTMFIGHRLRTLQNGGQICFHQLGEDIDRYASSHQHDFRNNVRVMLARF